MDSMGTLDLTWAQGYNGERAEFINRDTVAYQCGNCIKFISDDGHESVFPSPGEGIGAFAVHFINKVFAVADITINPKICIFQYPSHRLVAELEDGASLEYHTLTFSASEFLATITGVPDHQLILWRYVDSTKLCTYDLSPVSPTYLSFNPANWRQLCLSTEKELTMWNIEQRDDLFVIQKEQLPLPADNARAGSAIGGIVTDARGSPSRDIPTRASTRMSRATVDLPVTAMAGVAGDTAERFQAYSDQQVRVTPVTHCWTPAGDILVGCRGGQLLRVDSDQLYVKVLINPGPLRMGSAVSRPDSTKSRLSEIDDRSYASLPEPSVSSSVLAGSLSCLALHKRGLYAGGDDGTLRHMEIANDVARIVEAVPVGSQITSLCFNATHHKMAVGSSRGLLHLLDPDKPGELLPLLEVHHGEVIGVNVLAPGNEYVVSVKKDGEVQVWNMQTAKLTAAMPVCYEASCLATSPLTHIVAIGTTAGYVFFIDFNKFDSPRIIERLHLHQGPVKHIVFNENGHFIVSGGNDGQVFVLDGRASKKFQPLGYVSIAGEVIGLSCHYSSGNRATKVVVTANQTKKANAANRIMHFDVPENLPNDLSEKHASLKQDFKDSAINKLLFNIASPSFGVAVTEGNIAFTMSNSSKKLHKILLPSEPPKKDVASESSPDLKRRGKKNQDVEETSKDSYIHPMEEVDGHQLPGGELLMSPHQKWLASYGTDGKLIIRAIGALERSIVVNAHSYRHGGVSSAAFSADASHMFTAGYDGTIACYKWSFSSGGQTKAKSAVESARNRQTSMLREMQTEDEAAMALPEWSHPLPTSRPASGTEKAEKEQLEKEALIEAAIEQDNIYSTPTPTPGADATWMEERHLEAHQAEDKQYSGLKKDLRTQIRDMRKQLQSMIHENDAVPDIERLQRHEFDLDIEEQRRLQAEGDAEVARIRQEKEFENLAKQYLAALIKKECWTDMEVKGRGLVAFNTPLEVQNYPLKPRTREELVKIDQIETRRQVEMAEKAAREEVIENKKPKKSARREYAEIRDSSKQNAPQTATVREAIKEKFNITDPDPIPPKVDEDALDPEDVENAKENSATSGSLGALFGGKNDLFYSQFEMHTREEKMSQIVLLEDAIYRIKQLFNKEFDKVYDKKQQEIAKIKDKNRRIYKILDDLELKMDMYEPEMGVIEKPEMLLSVEDEETPEVFPQSIAPLDQPHENMQYERYEVILPPGSAAGSKTTTEDEEEEVWEDVPDENPAEQPENQAEQPENPDNTESRPASKPSVGSARSRKSKPSVGSAKSRKSSAAARKSGKGVRRSGKSSAYKMSALDFLAMGSSSAQQPGVDSFATTTLTERRADRSSRPSSGSNQWVTSRKASPLLLSSSAATRSSRSGWKSWHRVVSCTTSSVRVRVEKFLTPEQKKRREEEKAMEADRKAREKGDNWRDRGLDCMMGGVLEIKKEDELKKDIPMPAFMTAKAEADWSEDEKKAVAEYEKKVKDLAEEREKYRKQLEMEQKKLQGLIQDSCEQFDEALKVLFQRKIKMEMVIYQEELKILRLKYSLLQEEELDHREHELTDLIEFKQSMKEVSSDALQESRKHVDAFREQYDKLCAEDKVMDRGFKREFNDVPAHLVDQLYKLFRRRPRGQKARGTETPIYDSSSGNPFCERPSTARQREQSERAVETALVDLDKESNAPEGVEGKVWERMCALRREKIHSEMLVKSKALVLASMQEFLQKRQDDDDKLRDEIETLFEDINKLKDDRLRFTCNLEVQLLLKQGQVEVDPTNFIPSYTHSLLLHRSVVEELNGRIRNLGEKKIASMVESKDFRKGIVQLEWEHKRMTMEMEDLQNKMRDIQNLKVTREIQSFLNESDHDSKKAKEIQVLEQTLLVMKQHHEKNINEKKKVLKEMQKSIRDHHDDNSRLSSELEELNVSVNERKHIHQVNADKRSDAGRDQRYKEIVQRRKLVDLAKAQAQEVAVLRAEVERLRMRTFPALVQVEH